MLTFEQIQSLELEQQKLQGNVLEKDSQRFGEKFTPTAAVHDHINEKMADNIFAGLCDMYRVAFEYDIASDKPISMAVENMAEEFQKSIKRWKQEKIMFSAPVYVSRGDGAILDYMIKKLHHLKNNDANINEDGKRKLEPVLSEVHDLVSKGNHVSKELLKLLPNDVLKKREDYLLNLKNIVRSSSDNNEEDIVVQRDNVFYCVKYPEESIVSPAKFLNNSEFQDLEGILKIGESNAIKIQNGQYRYIKGKVKMTFKVGDDEKVEMILFSEKAEDFGKIMVHMDDKSCGVFLKHCENLEEELRTSEIVGAAKAFVQTKINAPSSNLDDTNLSQHSKEVLTM